MKFLFKFAGAIKVIFLLSIFFLNFWRKIEFQKKYSNNLGAFTFDIEFPWYIYLILLIIITSFFFNIITVNIIAFLPNSKTSKYLLKKPVSKLIYLFEVLLLISALVALYNNFDEAFSRPSSSLFGQSVEFFTPTPEPSYYEVILKLETLNYILPVLSAILILGVFWKFRDKCLQNMQS
jgi:hypothetical protein